VSGRRGLLGDEPMQGSTLIRTLLLLSALGLVWLGGHIGRQWWCAGQLKIPIFKDEELTGTSKAVVAKLGRPAQVVRGRAGSLFRQEPLRILFRSGDLKNLGGREVTLSIWHRECLGSTIWRFVVVTDARHDDILLVGGKASFYALVYFGGGHNDARR